eukprot:jgi/Tetstr1/455822/TSEL_042614.t1
MGLELNSQHTLILSMFREFVTRMMKSHDPGVPAGLCWRNVNRLLKVAEAEARAIPMAVDQRQEDIWTCGWRVLFFIYCLLKLKPEDERRAALLSAGTCREFSTKALESFRNNVVQQRSAQDGVIKAPTDTDIVPMDLCARVGKPKDGMRPFTPWAARRIAQPMELLSPSQALRARFIGNKQLQSGQPTPFKLGLTDAQKTLLEMAMECLVDMSSKQWNEMGFGIQGGRIQVILPPEDMLDIADHTQGHERHCLTERTLAETYPGAADFIMSHKNLMQPLEDLERGMGVPEEETPYMEQYHGYMFGSDTTHRGPAGAPFELPSSNPCPKCPGVAIDEDYASIHARAKELRLVVEAAAPAAAAAASIPP